MLQIRYLPTVEIKAFTVKSMKLSATSDEVSRSNEQRSDLDNLCLFFTTTGCG